MKAATRSSVRVSDSPRGVRRTVRWVVAALLLAPSAGLSVGDNGPARLNPSTPPAAESGAVANLRIEVRLRKLHLVRPDLIQYPLAFDVVC
ncbi:MAG: hypothetical protein JWO31_3457 [Phycisphaerales bacterium]|nr:hypothetical protein [Phycisphaerales bacterium]